MYHHWRFFILILLATFGTLAAGGKAAAADDRDDILVGRIAHVEGKLLRYVEEGKDWVVTVKDAPFGLEDALYAGENTRAEFILPNQTWLRVGENTQVQLLTLNQDTTTVDVASGLARLYNKSRDAVVKVTTPFGYVVAPGDTIFDLYVGDESMEVIAVRGNVDFVHDSTQTRYEVREGDSSIIADRSGTARGNGTVDSIWDDWNGQRDDLWAQRLRTRGQSTEYLPEPIRDQAYSLEENGRWERVYYEGDYRDMWRPTRIDPGWRPFTAGRWSVYYGDNCWIPDEPFGYVTHHYGSWVYVEPYRTWYWLPPVVRVVADTPRFFIGFGWYPGRVGWIHSGPSIGWVPLAPDEVYYGYRPWGHRTVVIHRTTVINLNIIRYRYLDGAVIINRDHLYRGTRYTPYIQKNIGRATIVNNYKPTTVINNTVINNFTADKRRFTFNDAKIDRKPHVTVVNRINDNQRLLQGAGRIDRERIKRDLTRVNAATQPTTTDVRAPMVTNKLVAPDKMTKPIDTVSLPKKEIKPKERQRPLVSDSDQSRGARAQGETGQLRETGDPNGDRRMRAARDARNQVMEQVGPATRPATEERLRGLRERGQVDQAGGEAADRDDSRQIRSPREVQQGQKTDQTPTETGIPADERLRGPRERGQVDQAGGEAADRDDSRQIRSPREVQQGQKTDQTPTETGIPAEERLRGPRERGQVDQAGGGAADRDGSRQIRSPREVQQGQKADQPPTETGTPADERLRGPRERGQVDQAGGGAADRDGSRQIRSPREVQQGQKVDQTPSETGTPADERLRGPRERGQVDQAGGGAADRDSSRQIRSPREVGQETERTTGQQDQFRDQEGLRRQEQDGQRRQQEQQRQIELQRQQQEEQKQRQVDIQRRQQEEPQQQRQQELQRRQQEEQQQRQVELQRRQQEEQQQQRQQEMQRRQQEEQQQRQVEIQRRQQEEQQQQRQQEIKRRQQEEQQQRQMEIQRRQQEEQQQQRQQDIQRRQQEEQQQRQVEMQRRQQEEQQQRQIEIQRRQQEEQQQRQVELQRRQQEEQQRRQQEAIRRQQEEQQQRQVEMQRRQQEEQQQRQLEMQRRQQQQQQQQQQQPSRKKKPQEEELQQGQQPAQNQ